MTIWKENYELMLQLRNFSIAYCTFVEAGGKAGDVETSLINKAISVAVKIKENRDYIEIALGRDVPSVKDECDVAMSILDGTYKDDRFLSIIGRIM